MNSAPRESGLGRVLLVEPVGILRASLEALLDGQDDLEVVGLAADAEEALEAVAAPGGHPTVVLVSLELGGDRDAFWLIRTLRDRSPHLGIIVTGTDLTRGAISQALFVGADGFIHKNSTPDRFVEATRRAARGELVLEGLPRDALGPIVDGVDQHQASLPTLTAREQMVLVAASDGLTAREIGRRLGVSERTVTTHLNHIYRKLGANGRVSALAIATRLGVLRLPDAADPVSRAAFAR
jgi:DNA-binding NarL/FixJ family response regulator